MKKVLLVLIVALAFTNSFAQSGTNSPFSMYGLGSLAEQSTGYSRGMNGVGIAFAEGNQVNFLNPASYSSIDSLTFIFDAALSIQNTNIAEGELKKNAKNADIEYAVGAFRVMKRLGLAFGIVPFTNVGYNYTYKTNGVDPLSSYKPNNSSDEYSSTSKYSGSGGLHQLFVGLGYSPIKNLSVGFNFSYLWGSLNRTVATSFTESSAKSLNKTYSTDISNYRLDFGVQYKYELNKKDNVTLGLTFTPGHKISKYADLNIITSSSSTGIADTLALSASDAYEIPTMLGLGVAYNHANKWKLAVDYTYQKWAGAVSPTQIGADGNSSLKYEAVKGLYSDRHKINVGGEYCQNANARSFISRIRYRAGIGYATPYLKINNIDGPSEISASAGFGIPISNSWNNRSMLNISFQAVRVNMKNVMREHVFRVNVGLTFNERWFAKWKFE